MELKKMWKGFEIKVNRFEEECMKKLLDKSGKKEEELSQEEWIEFGEKVDTAVGKKFNREAKELVSIHVQETK